MKPPLTREQLKDIQDRYPLNRDVRDLLWEVKRLRALALRTHDYFRQQPTSSTGQAMAEALRNELEREPVVIEQPKL